jgi:putative addiction module component (TIGR02574 family)
MIAEKIPVLDQLSIEEKWLLANELIAEVDAQQTALPSSSEIQSIVAKRFAAYERDPSTAMTLESFKLRFSLP